jgi:hypothetical protein
MDVRQRREERPARSSRLRSAFTSTMHIGLAAAACTLWAALAMPGLHLVPGAGHLADQSVAISLQSALLGIDDTTGRPSYSSVLADAHALGLTPTEQLLSHDLLRLRAEAESGTLITQLDVRVRNAAEAAAAPTSVAPPPAPPAPPRAQPQPIVIPLVSPPAPVLHIPLPHIALPPVSKPTPPVVSAPPLPALQTIVFTSTPPAHALVGSTPYVVAARASSGLPVSFSVDLSSLGTCKISGAIVTFLGTGTCTLDANQTGSSGYYAAPQVQQSFAVGHATAPSLSLQSVHFASSPPAGAAVGGSTSLAATASSGLPVEFEVDSASAGVCTVVGTTVHFDGIGTCTIRASQPGDASYQTAPLALLSFSVGLAVQTISFTSVPPSGAVVGFSTYNVAAAATSGLPVVYSPDPASAGVCTVSGSTVTPVGAGTCIIEADQFGDSTFDVAPAVQQSFSVGSGAPSLSVQSIHFSSTPPGSAVVGSSYNVAAAASSGLPVVFSAPGSGAGVCAVSGTTVSFVGVGTCTVSANQVGNGSYLSAPQVQQSFAVGEVPQTISFTTPPPAGALVGDPAYVVAATSSSGLAVVFSADAASAGVCTVSGSSVSLIGVGTCTVDADQPGNATFLPSVQVQQTFAVAAPSLSVQTITFTSTPPAGATAGGSPYTVSASASSGLAVSLSADPSSAGICTVSASTVSFLGAGTCTIDADQSGNGSYQAATQVQQSFAIGLAAQTIGFTTTPPSPVDVGDPDYAVGATATSGLAVVFSTDASSSGICTVSGSSVTLVGAGTCTIDADQPGDASHQAAPQVQQSFTVGTGPPAPSVQSVSFTSTAPSGAMVGGSYTVTAAASSGLPVSFSAEPASAGICTVSASTVSFVGAGTCTIDANQAGNAGYQAAAQVQQSLAVGLAAQTISFTSTPPSGALAGGSGYAVAANASSGLPVAFTLSAGSAGVCTISGNTISFVGGGTCTVNANQAGNGSYLAAPQVQQSFIVSASPPPKSPQAIHFTSSAPAGAVVGGSYIATATSSSGLAVVFSADATSAGICTVSGSSVSLVGAGTCKIDANQPGNGSYLAAPQVQQSFAVGVAAQTISFTSTPPGSAVVGGAPYAVGATASSGLAVIFSADATSAGICTVSGSTVSLVGAGICRIDANQPGNGSYQAAVQVQQTFTVSRGSQTITFTSTAPTDAGQNDPLYAPAATASSGLAVTFTIDPASSHICFLFNSRVFFFGQGNCVVHANQAGNASYLPAPQVQQVIFSHGWSN